jgi:hypothetical protein
MDEREERDDVATTGTGGKGPGRDSTPGSAGEPLTEDASTSAGTHGETPKPHVGEPEDELPHREEAGM